MRVPEITLPDGAVLSYEDRGSGRPLVLLHGVCMSSDFFREQLGPLSHGHRVIALDFRGHGRSPACDHGHTVAQYARDVHHVLEALALEHAVLVGWSMGSIVIWQYLRQFGAHRVAAQVVISQGPSDLKRPDWPHGLLELAELAELCLAIQEDMAGAFADFGPAMFAEPLDEESRARVMHEILRCRPTTATAILLSQTLPDARVAARARARIRARRVRALRALPDAGGACALQRAGRDVRRPALIVGSSAFLRAWPTRRTRSWMPTGVSCSTTSASRARCRRG
jgi:non-heme chloroperoxidase